MLEDLHPGKALVIIPFVVELNRVLSNIKD
jgi:hypothetical protein